MIAYNKKGLANLRLQEQMKKQLDSGCITDTEFKNIKEKYAVNFYMPGLFARIGLFLLTVIVIAFADGLLTLIFASSDLIAASGWLFFLGILSYVTLERIINTKHHYRSGVDDALLLSSALLLSAGFAMLFSHYNKVSYLAVSGGIFILTLYFSIRFADSLMSALGSAALLAFVFFGWTKLIPYGMATIAFVMMIVSGVLYWISVIWNKKAVLADYRDCLIIIQTITLLTLYAAGNYYVIQTLSYELNGKVGKGIPFSLFFWIWTMVVPFIYIVFGIRKKDVILIRVGLLLIACAVITFRAYYQVLPLDVALTLGGALILGIAYAFMKYLKTPKYGFTYAEPDEEQLMDNLKVESLIVADTFSKVPAAPASEGTKFGDGDFGGGGSSSSF